MIFLHSLLNHILKVFIEISSDIKMPLKPIFFDYNFLIIILENVENIFYQFFYKEYVPS